MKVRCLIIFLDIERKIGLEKILRYIEVKKIINKHEMKIKIQLKK